MVVQRCFVCKNEENCVVGEYILKISNQSFQCVSIHFLDALKELKKAKSQNESSAALEEMVTKLSEEKLKTANDIDNYKRSGLKLSEELEQLNNKYQDLEADFSSKKRYVEIFLTLLTLVIKH